MLEQKSKTKPRVIADFVRTCAALAAAAILTYLLEPGTLTNLVQVIDVKFLFIVPFISAALRALEGVVRNWGAGDPFYGKDGY